MGTAIPVICSCQPPGHRHQGGPLLTLPRAVTWLCYKHRSVLADGRIHRSSVMRAARCPASGPAFKRSLTAPCFCASHERGHMSSAALLSSWGSHQRGSSFPMQGRGGACTVHDFYSNMSCARKMQPGFGRACAEWLCLRQSKPRSAQPPARPQLRPSARARGQEARWRW